ncbi:MAG TPA: DUF885 domain-containing protein, partial [candidate division Zixibacteria bacterium]|nr:DUF885 domain-containing protein [candidate division Zixibacteria bacterium]
AAALFLCGPAPAAAAAEPGLDNLCDQILAALQAFYPVRSTEMGIHDYDHRFTDYSSSSVRDMVKRLAAFDKKLAKYRAADLPADQAIRCRLIQSNVDAALLDLKQISWHTRLPQLYVDEAVNGLYLLLGSRSLAPEQAAVSVLARMKAVPALLETARKNIRRPPQVWIDEAVSALVSAEVFYGDAGAEMARQFPARAEEFRTAAAAAQEVLRGFSDWLRRAEPGDPGAFAIGADNFNYKLAHEHFLPYTADSLLALGEALLVDADSAYDEYRRFVEEEAQNGSERVFIPRCFSRADILDYYAWEVAQVRAFCADNEIVTVPQNIAPVAVVETPPYLQSMITGIAYQPAGPFDTAQQALFFVRPVPDPLDSAQLSVRARYIHRRGFRGSVVHEAYPGHHLQTQVAGMHDDPVRKWQSNSLAVEGWALYCEQMMYEAGLYGGENPAMWLAILDGIRFRAARIVADVKLHTGRMTYDECVDWMIDTLDIDTDSGREYIRNQVRLYTHRPTYQMSYLIGKLEILKLRDAMIDIEGESFSLRAFHDAYLSEGSIPPALVWKAWELETAP